MFSKDIIVIAIGGNSLIKDAQHMSVLDQYRAAGETSEHIAELIEQGYRLVITHGNGPQVGFILLRSERAKDILHQIPLESCSADTQGAIGYQISQTLSNALRERGLKKDVVALITQVRVDPNDPGFNDPDKPIGPFYKENEVKEHEEKEGWIFKEDAGRGWRRAVASPLPLEIMEISSIKDLLKKDYVVIAAGGGGIPVIRKENGDLEGVSAVIDKDRTSCLLAKNLGAKIFIISTAVDNVCLNFNTPNQKIIKQMTVQEAKTYVQEGHFSAGSMLPKIHAAIDFLENGGERVVITQPHLLEKALSHNLGTHIIP